MDNDLPAEQAEQLVCSVALPQDSFEWYQVSKEVNKVGNNGEALIRPAWAVTPTHFACAKRQS
jgi:putative SOS response-associated peptidase YedK